MKYLDARPQIKSGDLLSWSHREPWYRSWYDFKIFCIRLFRMTPWTHVGTAWAVGDRLFVLEAVMPKVRIYPLSKCGDFGWVKLNAPWKPGTLGAALEYVGEDYSQVEAMEAPFKELQHTGKWQCAKLAAWIARCDGIDLGRTYTPDAVLEAALQREGAELVMVQGRPK